MHVHGTSIDSRVTVTLLSMVQAYYSVLYNNHTTGCHWEYLQQLTSEFVEDSLSHTGLQNSSIKCTTNHNFKASLGFSFNNFCAVVKEVLCRLASNCMVERTL